MNTTFRSNTLSFLRFICRVSCLVGFMIVSFFSITHFLEGKTTVTSTHQDHSNAGIKMPWVTICNESGFKNQDLNQDLEQYLASVIAPEDLVAGNPDFPYEKDRENIIVERKELWTQFKGRCLTYQYNMKVLSTLCS